MHTAPLKKLHSHNSTFRRAFVKGCTDKLREIELRLDHGCSRKWLAELDLAEDLSGVAKLLLPLQRRASVSGLEDGWLEKLITLPRADLEDDQAELSRRMMHRLDKIDQAVPAGRKPTEMLGEVVLKHFDGFGTFMGTVVEYDEDTGFRLQFDDGDTEDVSLRDLRKLFPRPAPWVELSDDSDDGDDAGDEAAEKGGSPTSRVPHAKNRKKAMLQAASEAAASPVVPLASTPTAPPAAAPASKSKGKSTSGSAVAPQPKSAKAQQPSAKTPQPQTGASGASNASGTKRPLEVDDELAQLPAGWIVESKGGKARSFVSPDGMTRFSTMAKVQRWHRQQIALAARFRMGKPDSPQAERPPAPAPAAAEPDAASSARGASGAERGGALSPRAGERSSPRGEVGGEDDGSALGPALASPGLGPAEGKKLPRELRNLAMPDREWNVPRLPVMPGGTPIGVPSVDGASSAGRPATEGAAAGASSPTPGTEGGPGEGGDGPPLVSSATSEGGGA